MTTTHERTRGVVDAGEFLERLSKDSSLPRPVRLEAKRLLRHFPSGQDISRAGRLENIRQRAIDELLGNGVELPPVLSTWPISETFFSGDDEEAATIVTMRI
ncbi:BPSL0761 family protein [Pseudomonas abietaniphila]|jgi:hypothetical protein|uniref:Uncharacterized protein n=1 Tax=Pseudomonas abietaniphila TaxID=89065 RepID=A0A1G7V7S5_9PSED|nr:hypothetical protein SAMN05216605_102416 [Pseudomonas abietaniphila]